MRASAKPRFLEATGTVLLGVILAFTAGSRAAAAPPENAPTYEDDVLPILQTRCFKCHGQQVRKAGLDLRRRFKILEGGDSGPAIVAGKPDESLLIEMITSGQMPPKEEGELDKRQLELITHWIAAGAPLKSDEEAPLEAADKDATVTEEDRQFWAFQPPVRPVVPQVKHGDQVRNPIDAFLLARLDEHGASFNPQAQKEVLARRLYFDLIGLPPTPEDLDAFLADDRPDAYERLVDDLLASPHYGVRWGRHWLDIAGYADSDGYLEADRLRPEAWRYRDYVIRAFNSDKPYDRFILEQVAGDELADWRRAPELTPELTDNLIATGFLRTALDPTYPGYAEKLECYKVMADTTQIVSSAFLGLTLECARCHSHKFDPISQRDYYRMHAIFIAAYDPDRWLVSPQRSIPLATEAQATKISQHNLQVDARLAQLNAAITELTNEFRDKFLKRELPDLTDDALREKIKAALLVEPAKRNEEQKQLVAVHAPNVALTEENLAARFPEYGPDLAQLKAAVDAETALKKSIVELRGLIDLDVTPRQAHLLRRGDFENLGQPVEPGFPAVLVPANFEFKAEAGYKTTGRRSALARWLVDPQHPLTARVHVNRMWAHHFGRGIVATADNFGTTGERPTHPELLDWLATEFIATGWSQKAMHRLMLNSTAYRQSSQPNRKNVAELARVRAEATDAQILANSATADGQPARILENSATEEFDPENKLLGAWRPQRHEGEVIRDTVLAVTGKLNPQMFGPPVPVNRDGDGLVTVADDANGNRRSMFLIVRRSQPVTLLELFDTPRMEVNCTRRTESIVVTQALTMMNSQFVESGAQALAARVLREAPAEFDARLDFAYKLLFGRVSRETERASIREFLENVAQAQLGDKYATATMEEKQAAADAAWVQLALVLLNSNEFLYVP